MGQHFYDAEGNPQHTQVVASGKNKGGRRSTTIRDARKYNLFPSVSGITSQLESEGLTDWKLNQVLTHGHEIARMHRHPDDTPTFVKRAKGMLADETSGYADFGTMVHEAIEKYINSEISGKDVPFTEEEMSYIDRWNTLIASTFPGLVYLGTEVSFGNAKLGYGGSVDVLAYDIILDTFVVPDLKTKRTTKGKKFYTSEKYPLQLVAYRDGFDRYDKLDFSKCPQAKRKLEGRSYGFPANDCIIGNLYISSTESDRQEWVEITTKDKKDATECFDLLRRMFFIRKGYDPTKASI